MAAAWMPSFSRFSTRRSAPRLVRTKKSDFSWDRQIAAATFTLSIWCTWMNRCSMAVTVWVEEATSWKTGSGGSRREAAQHPFDLRHEPHVGHAVRLVEHQRLELINRQLAAVAQVDQSSRR